MEKANLSRAAHRYMCSWTRRNFDVKLSQEENWERAEAAWNHLSPEMHGYLIILSDREVRHMDTIRQGLLATLASCQGTQTIKELFEKAICGVDYK